MSITASPALDVLEPRITDLTPFVIFIEVSLVLIFVLIVMLIYTLIFALVFALIIVLFLFCCSIVIALALFMPDTLRYRALLLV